MPIPSDVRRVNIYATLADGEEMVHTLHCQVNQGAAAPEEEPNLQEQADFVRNSWDTKMLSPVTTGWKNYLSVSAAYWRVAVYSLTSAGTAADLAEAFFTPPIAGVVASRMPHQIALCCSLRTGRPGASYRGRLYLGGMATNTMDNSTGRVVGGARLQAATRLADFLTTVNGQNTPLSGIPTLKYGVLSRKEGVITPITQVSVDNLFDVQGRRKENQVGVRDTMPVENRET